MTFRSDLGATGCSNEVCRFTLVNHLATMDDLHPAGRYDRMSDDVLTLTGKRPLRMQEFVRKNASAFTASAKAS